MIIPDWSLKKIKSNSGDKNQFINNFFFQKKKLIKAEGSKQFDG